MKRYEEGYIWKLEKEILDEKEAIEQAYHKVENKILNGDIKGLVEDYRKLFNRQQNFEIFKKVRVDAINEYIQNNISEIVSILNKEDIRNEYNESLSKYFAVNILVESIAGKFGKITDGWRTGPDFSYIICNKEGKRYLDFIVELYKYNKNSLSDLYSKYTFKELPPELKKEIFKDTIINIQNHIKHKSASIDIICEGFSDMLDDKDIKSLLSEHKEIKVIAKHTSDILDSVYPVSKSVLDEEDSKVPKSLQDAVNKFCGMFEEHTEIAKEDIIDEIL